MYFIFECFTFFIFLTKEMILVFSGINTKKQSIFNITQYFIKKNILYTKLFQSIALHTKQIDTQLYNELI